MQGFVLGMFCFISQDFKSFKVNLFCELVKCDLPSNSICSQQGPLHTSFISSATIRTLIKQV